MSRRLRCERCRRPQSQCLCASIVPVENRWPVHIIQHPNESRHALGTARIARLGLGNCVLTSSKGAEISAPDDAVLIYPGETSLPLSALSGTATRTLVFIDATWRKSRRMLFESPELAALPRYCLTAPPGSRYRIRKEPNSQALSTLEAIVYALIEIEGGEHGGDSQRYLRLLDAMDQLIRDQVEHMGAETFRNNYGL